MNGVAPIELNSLQRELIAQIRNLAQSKFAVRAAEYDRSADFPAEDFADLFESGLLSVVVPPPFGGLGLGPYHGNVLTLWLLTKEIAKADMSLARCWEGHVNSLVLLDGIATDEQKERWFTGVVNDGDIWVAWSGEPQARASSEKLTFGTTTTKVEGGFIVDGKKAFATSAGGAKWAILLVSTAGPGGARHQVGRVDAQLLLVCDLRDSSISIDRSWWDPIGMRGTASHVVEFHQTFIPEANLVGRPRAVSARWLADLFHTPLRGDISGSSRSSL